MYGEGQSSPSNTGMIFAYNYEELTRECRFATLAIHGETSSTGLFLVGTSTTLYLHLFIIIILSIGLPTCAGK